MRLLKLSLRLQKAFKVYSFSIKSSAQLKEIMRYQFRYFVYLNVKNNQKQNKLGWIRTHITEHPTVTVKNMCVNFHINLVQALSWSTF